MKADEYVVFGLLLLFFSCNCLSIKDRSRVPSYEDFLRRHVLDPNEYPDYQSWDDEIWTAWIVERFGETPIGSRQVHSVIIAPPNSVEYSFSSDTVPCIQGPWSRYWSAAPFIVVVLWKDLFDPFYRILDCNRMYVLAGLDIRDRPIHFEKQRYDLSGISINKSTTEFQRCQTFNYCDL